MNASDSKEGFAIPSCPTNEMAWSMQYRVEKNGFAITAIILNAISCPFSIVMNVLVIVAVKTMPRLRNKYSILLACLAATDVSVGVVVQPTFIALQTEVLKGVSLTQYCSFFKMTFFVFHIPVSTSLFHLNLLSMERLVAMKYTLHYTTIVTTRTVTVAVVCSWVIASLPAILYSISEDLEIIIRTVGILFSFFNVVTIVFCHVSVYFVTRRHERQIKSEQVSQEAIANFAKEKKALKTTRIIILTLVFCYFPSFIFLGMITTFRKSSSDALNVITLSHPLCSSCVLLNSLCNPVIYFCRNKMFRKAFKDLLKINGTNSNNIELELR